MRQGKPVRWDAADIIHKGKSNKKLSAAETARKAMLAKYGNPNNKPVTPEEAYKQFADKGSGADNARKRMLSRMGIK